MFGRNLTLTLGPTLPERVRRASTSEDEEVSVIKGYLSNLNFNLVNLS